MGWIKHKLKQLQDSLDGVIRDDTLRRELMFEWLNLLLALVSFFMTVVNLFTREYTLMLSTLVFAVACVGNVLLLKWSRPGKGALYFLFVVETLALLSFFLISGIPNGFSALWLCLIPSFSLLIFGWRAGTWYSAITFWMLLFFFWLPAGRGLLRYRYTSEFMLRFPLFFAACYLLALFVELVRARTQKHLLDSEQKYYYLCRHDPLTGLYNRYGFYAIVDDDFAAGGPGQVGMLILDIDNFKRINDCFGHGNGDIVLRGIAQIIQSVFCEKAPVCRWGGEEFTVYLHCEHDYAEAAERLRRQVEQAEFRSGSLVMKVTVSIGLCVAPSIEEANIAMLVNRADQCLYAAKAQGKNRVVCTELK